MLLTHSPLQVLEVPIQDDTSHQCRRQIHLYIDWTTQKRIRLNNKKRKKTEYGVTGKLILLQNVGIVELLFVSGELLHLQTVRLNLAYPAGSVNIFQRTKELQH